jgi:hypothetical protein
VGKRERIIVNVKEALINVGATGSEAQILYIECSL